MQNWADCQNYILELIVFAVHVLNRGGRNSQSKIMKSYSVERNLCFIWHFWEFLRVLLSIFHETLLHPPTPEEFNIDPVIKHCQIPRSKTKIVC